MSKFVVCPECEGEGYLGTLGAYTSDEFDQAFEDWEEYTQLHEASKEPCGCCKAKRVVTAEQLEDWQYELECRAERAAESRGYGY